MNSLNISEYQIIFVRSLKYSKKYYKKEYWVEEFPYFFFWKIGANDHNTIIKLRKSFCGWDKINKIKLKIKKLKTNKKKKYFFNPRLEKKF